MTCFDGVPRQIQWSTNEFSHRLTVQATPMNAAVLPLRSWAGLCHRYGVPDLFRWPNCTHYENYHTYYSDMADRRSISKEEFHALFKSEVDKKSRTFYAHYSKEAGVASKSE